MTIQTFDPNNSSHIDAMIDTWEDTYHAVQANDPTDYAHPDFCLLSDTTITTGEK